MKAAIIAGCGVLSVLSAPGAHAVDCRVDNTPLCNCLRRTVIGLRGTALHNRMEKSKGIYGPMARALLGACWRHYNGE